MRVRTPAVTVIVAVLVAWAVPAGAADQHDAARDAAAWLAKKQTGSGSFGADRADHVGDTLASVVAGGGSASTIDRAMEYLEEHALEHATRAAYTARIIHGVVAGGGDADAFGGADLEERLDSFYDPETGAWEADELFANLEAANGKLAAAGALPERAVTYIEDNACAGGGFGFDNGCARGPDVDTTSWAISVLVAAGRDGAVVDAARNYLLSVQRPNGGFPFAAGGSLPVSADSTGLALSAIAALGEDPESSPWRQPDGDDPVRALIRLQHDSGGFRSSSDENDPNFASTKNAVPGLAGFPYPIRDGLGPKAKPGPTRRPDRTAAPDDGRRTDAPPRPDDPRDDTRDRRGDGSAEERSGPGAGNGPGVGAPFLRWDDPWPSDAAGGEVPAPAVPGDVQSFDEPLRGAATSTPLRSPILWGGVAAAVVGSGLGIRWVRARAR